MCGIAGIVRFDDRPVGRARLGAMLEALSRRGPDGLGMSDAGRCALGATQLSIIDLLSGAQPMHLGVADAPISAEQDGLYLVFNGEIYNHRALRKKLERRGHTFASSHSDTEVLLLGYREWGDQLPKHLQGMWAFAVWDAAKRELFLCRDRVGEKPLYLMRRGDELRFGSLVGAVLAGREPGEAQDVDPGALQTYLRLGYTLDRPLLSGLEEVPPAHCLTIDAQGKRTVKRYWRPPPISRSVTSLGAVQSLREVIGESVRNRLLADVPLGAVLSGGIGSSLVAAVADRFSRRECDQPLRTFTVALDCDAPTLGQAGARIAEHLGTRHTALTASTGRVIGDLESLVAESGDPLADPGLLVTYWRCKAVREHAEVALSGVGANELFGGHARYRAMNSLARHRWWIARLPAGRLPDTRDRGRRFNRMLAAARTGASPQSQYLRLTELVGEGLIHELAPNLAQRNGWSAVPDWPDEYDQGHAAMRWDLTHALACRVLRRIDRASMAVALEVRCPLLGTPVLDLAGHLPTSVLMPRGRPMGLLREVAATVLPAWAVRLTRPAARPPLGRWFREKLHDELNDRLSGDVLGGLGIDSVAVGRLIEQHQTGGHDHADVLFALLQLAIWRRWLSDQSG